MTLQILGSMIEPVSWWDAESQKQITYQRVRGLMTAPDAELIVSSEFGIVRPQWGGLIHTAADVAIGMGTPIYWGAPDGFGIFSGQSFIGLGNAFGAIVEDDEGVRWLIAIGHMRDRPLVARGEYIRRGQLIGYVGSTGQSSGPHMHIMVARALDYDHAPGVSESDEEGDYAEFWQSPRGSSSFDTGPSVSRLHNVLDFLTEDIDPDLLPLWSPLPPRDRAAGDVTLVTTTRAVGVETFEHTAHADGIASLYAGATGEFVGFIVGAPRFVNTAFLEEVEDDEQMIPAGTILVAVS